MEPFQVKKPVLKDVNDFNQLRSVQGVDDDNLVTFGNRDDLKSTCPQGISFGFSQMLHRQFHPGNYVLSKSTDDDSNLSLVIHHENVDAKAILNKLHEKSMELAMWREIGGGNNYEEYENDDDEYVPIEYEIADGKRCLVRSIDWFKKEKRFIDGTWKICDDIEQCAICEKSGVDFDHPTATSIVDYYVMHKIYDAHIQLGDNPIEAKSKAMKYLELLFVVNNLSWMDTTEWKLTPIDDGKMYQLEVLDGVKIGYAFDVKQYFGEENVRGMLLQDSSDNSVIALILEPENADLLRPEAFVHPMSEFLYESEYRRFVENGQKQENPYFGEHDDQSPFSDLPPNLFVKIVSYLSLKERVLVRRVSQRLLEISNDVLAVGTKQIDLQRDRMIRNWTNADLNRMIPLMAGGLESMRLPYYMPAELIDFEFIRPDVSFRSLREINIGRFTLKSDRTKILMEKAPNLKTFTGMMQLNVSEEAAGDRRCFKSVEELVLGCYDFGGAINIGDSYLMALIDLFPNIRRLSLHELNFVSASAASVMAERLGPKLEELIMCFDIIAFDFGGGPAPLGVFDGIRSCVNLKALMLVNSHYISTGCTEALATGCPQLETLVLSRSPLPNDSSVPLEKLATLTKLTKLKVSDIEGVSDGLMPVVREGRLEQLLLDGSRPSVNLIKTCVRCCTGLLLLDVNSDECTTDDALEIIALYGRYGCTKRTVIRTENQVWSSAEVGELQLAMKNGNHPHRGLLFVVDMRSTPYEFVQNAVQEYENADPNVLLLEDDEMSNPAYIGGSDDGNGDFDDDGDEDYGDEDEEDDGDVDLLHYDEYPAV